MSSFNREELDALVDFLGEGYGRIAAAVVSGPTAGDELVEELERRFGRSTLTVAFDLTPTSLKEQAEKTATAGQVIVLMIDGRKDIVDSVFSEEFWRQLNYQREHLVCPHCRVLLILDDFSDQMLSRYADDLREWVAFFRFPAAESLRRAMKESKESISLPSEELYAGKNIPILRDQLRRAREIGLAEGEITSKYALPLFLYLVASGNVGEAKDIWARELRGGEAIPPPRLPDDYLVFVLRLRLAELTEDYAEWDHVSRAYLGAARGLVLSEPVVDRSVVQVYLDSIYRRAYFLLGKECSQEAARLLLEGLEEVDYYKDVLGRAETSFGRALFLSRLSFIAFTDGRLSEALQYIESTLESLKVLTDAEPENPRWLDSLSIALNDKGRILNNLGRPDEAAELHRASLEIATRLHHGEPENTEFHRSVGVTWERLSDALASAGRLGEAVSAAEERYRVAVQLRADEPDNKLFQRDYRFAQSRLLKLLLETGNFSRAVEIAPEGSGLSFR